jgi:hypothetical protein
MTPQLVMEDYLYQVVTLLNLLECVKCAEEADMM